MMLLQNSFYVKFSQIEGTGRKFSPRELSNSVISTNEHTTCTMCEPPFLFRIPEIAPLLPQHRVDKSAPSLISRGFRPLPPPPPLRFTEYKHRVENLPEHPLPLPSSLSQIPQSFTACLKIGPSVNYTI